MALKWFPPIRACGCLNIRVDGLTSSFVRFEVVYPFLADLVLQQGDPPAYYLVCLVCRKAVLQNSFRAWHTDEIVYEPDPNTGRHYLTIPYARRVPTQKYALLTNGFENQAGFSRTLRLIVPNSVIDLTEFEVGLPNELKYLNFDIRKEELAFIASSLVNASIKNALGTQVSALKASSSPKAAYSALGSDAAKLRHDIEILCGIVRSHYHKPAIPSMFQQSGCRDGVCSTGTPAPSPLPIVPEVAKDFVVPYLERITEFEMSTPNLEVPSTPPLTLVDLPIETCWRIVESLEIEHIPGDPMVVQDYIRQRAQLARLATVSKGFAQIIIPILYRHIIIFAEPISVEKLCRALGTYNGLVKRLTVDDVQLGDRYPDVHIRNCRVFIERCVRACEGLVSVECYGDYQLFASSRITPPSSTSSSASSSRSSTPDSDSPDTPVYCVSKTIQSMVIGCPTWLPIDISFELRYVQHHLRDLTIINWGSQDILPYVHIKIKLPKLRSLCLKEGFIPGYVVQDLLMTTFNDDDESKGEYSGVGGNDGDRTSLRELSLLDLMALPELSILHILAFRNIGQQLTALRIGLPFDVQRETEDDFPLKVLELCPHLEDFTYLSPCSVKVFDVLPKTVRKLVFAVFVVPYSQIMKPLDGTALRYEDFIPFVRNRGVGRSRRSGYNDLTEHTPAAYFGKLEELTIVRRFCHDGRRLSYDPPGATPLRLNIWQQRLGCRELEDACREAGVSLRYHQFRMNLTATRGYGV